MQDKLSLELIKNIQSAQSIAISLNHTQIDLAHLAMASIDKNLQLSKILEQIGCPASKLKKIAAQQLEAQPKTEKPTGDLKISRDMERLLILAERESQDRKSLTIETQHIVKALLDIDSPITNAIKNAGADAKLLDEIEPANGEKSNEFLKLYTINLTQQAKEGKLDPVIGRDDEIRRVMQILSRRTKNNPVLIGEPGVGKTAIAEGLALRIINKEAPDSLLDKEILALDMAGLLAGTKFRGEFEERMKGLLKEIEKNQNTLILFIDEIHTLVGAGKTEGSMDAGNMLKPALARGQLHCIGATTLDEYRTGIEKDPALERRFQKVIVNEPSFQDSVAILRGLKEKYEFHHQVKIQDAALIAAVELSTRYISDRFLPDKAIDLMDEAASRIKLQLASKPEELDNLDRRYIQLKMEKMALDKETDDASKKQLSVIEIEIAEIEGKQKILEEKWRNEKNTNNNRTQLQQKIESAKAELSIKLRNAEYEAASKLQYDTIPKLEEEYAKTNATTEKSAMLKVEVGAKEIAEAVSKATGIPVNKLLNSEKIKLSKLQDILGEKIAGQNHAVKSVSETIKRSRMGINDPNKPIGTFLFMGPTGVGKTETAKAIAATMFDSEKALVRIDMSEYMDKHSVSRLIGAPPGYVGYEEGGQLTETIRRKPYAVILLDEIEKAHPDCANILLQLLDEGRLTDGQGRTVDFRNTIVIMTTNIGAKAMQENPNFNDFSIQSIAIAEARLHFKPELFNRFDEVIVFKPLTPDAIKIIAKIQCDTLCKRMAKQEINLTISDEVIEMLSTAGFDQTLGARPLKREIQKTIENALVDAMLSGEVIPHKNYRIEPRGDFGVRFKELITTNT